MAQNNTITFYDLALSTGATISPFVWATKYALKHKGFDLDVVPGGFTGIPERNPEVCVSTCRTEASAVKRGQCRAIGSSRSARPRSTSSSTASAITGLPTE